MKKAIIGAGVFVALFVTVSDVRAGPTFFTDQASFDAAISGVTPNFESFETPFATSATVNFADFTITGDQVIVSIPTGGFTAVPTDGSNTIGIVDNNFNGNSVTFTFDSPINFFSVDTIGPLNFGGAGFVRMSNDNGASGILATVPPPLTNSTVVFGGLIDDMATFSSVTIFTSQAGDGVQFDSLNFGLLASTPEPPIPMPVPGSLSLFLVGLIGLGLFEYRRCRS